MVNFDLLISKLKYIGFTDFAASWFYNYLYGRKQRIKHNNDIYSEYKTTTSGVPQGSMLGPLLFSIFTFDLPSAIEYSQLHLYPDDIQLYRSFSLSNIKIAISQLNEDILCLACWCSDNGLRVNPNKTVALCFGSER